ncbi:hypothetical protein NWF24_21220 [Variovorax paradoxus]|uniref:hypothetical protein n=1 Tax=Variovorax paradoxus TaxID=34073 RepID=UPI0021AD2850|nr:hypothetical protein [Variovorax paradoxus]UVH55349.1 hypothetical protein NWF24_21220 [Variovorax paradoxus]
MFYVESDVLRLLHDVPYFRFMKAESALRFWTQLRDDGLELTHILHQFPSVKYQPLDMLYACARAAASLDEELISDLTTDYSWQGVVHASFLAALQPHAAYSSYLRRARDKAPHNEWIVDLALCEIRGSLCERHSEHQRVIRELREVIANVPKQATNLRRGPTADELLQLQSATAAVADAYRKGGAAQARAVLNASAWRTFL